MEEDFLKAGKVSLSDPTVTGRFFLQRSRVLHDIHCLPGITDVVDSMIRLYGVVSNVAMTSASPKFQYNLLLFFLYGFACHNQK